MSIDTIREAAAAAGVAENVIRAGVMFYNRKNRLTNPPGDFDKRGRFYADERTRAVRQCRSPSAAWPYSQMTAARTAQQCAQVCGVSEDDLLTVRRIARFIETQASFLKAHRDFEKAIQKCLREEEAAFAAAFEAA